MHSQAHDQAAKKYAISAKSVDPEQAKIHRKLGRFHKTISAALSQIAGVHTSNDFNRAIKKKAENMANKKVNEDALDEGHGVFLKGGSIGTKHDSNKPIKVHDNLEDAKAHAKRMNKLLSPGEKNYYRMKYHVKQVDEGYILENEDGDVILEDEDFLDEDMETVTEHIDLFNALYDNEPGAFSTAFASLMQRKALERIEEIKIDLAHAAFADVEEIDEDVEQVDEISTAKLGRYSQRAMNDVRNSNQAIGRRDKGDPFRKMEGDDAKYMPINMRNAKNREKGVRTALNKLTGNAKVAAKE
jgi:hypothetical protein